MAAPDVRGLVAEIAALRGRVEVLETAHAFRSRLGRVIGAAPLEVREDGDVSNLPVAFKTDGSTPAVDDLVLILYAAGRVFVVPMVEV